MSFANVNMFLRRPLVERAYVSKLYNTLLPLLHIVYENRMLPLNRTASVINKLKMCRVINNKHSLRLVITKELEGVLPSCIKTVYFDLYPDKQELSGDASVDAEYKEANITLSNIRDVLLTDLENTLIHECQHVSSLATQIEQTGDVQSKFDNSANLYTYPGYTRHKNQDAAYYNDPDEVSSRAMEQANTIYKRYKESGNTGNIQEFVRLSPGLHYLFKDPDIDTGHITDKSQKLFSTKVWKFIELLSHSGTIPSGMTECIKPNVIKQYLEERKSLVWIYNAIRPLVERARKACDTIGFDKVHQILKIKFKDWTITEHPHAISCYLPTPFMGDALTGIDVILQSADNPNALGQCGISNDKVVEIWLWSFDKRPLEQLLQTLLHECNHASALVSEGPGYAERFNARGSDALVQPYTGINKHKTELAKYANDPHEMMSRSAEAAGAMYDVYKAHSDLFDTTDAFVSWLMSNQKTDRPALDAARGDLRRWVLRQATKYGEVNRERLQYFYKEFARILADLNQQQ